MTAHWPLLPGPVAVVAHDAGGAELLSSLLLRWPQALREQALLVLEGPARAVFARKLDSVQAVSLQAALGRACSVLTGTGWQSTLEWDALGRAHAQGLRCVAFVDHWVHYRERFERGGVVHWPDELWVGDEQALALARQVLPQLSTRLVPNPYVADMAALLNQYQAYWPRRDPTQGVRVLYVCEPIREPALRTHGNERHWGYTEEEALAYALDVLPRLGHPIECVVVRPHPSEAPDKYDAQLARARVPVQRGGALPLLEEVAHSDWVVGCNSMAMVIGLAGHKTVWCAVPPGGAACLLPQPQIGMLRDQPGANSDKARAGSR
jgi:hypothetical protein